MLVNMPGTSLILNSSLVLSCFLCATWPSFPFMVLVAHSPCTEIWLFFIFCISGTSSRIFFFGNYHLACQALELMWRGGSQHIPFKLRGQCHQMLPDVMVPALAHGSDWQVFVHHTAQFQGVQPQHMLHVHFTHCTEVLVHVAWFEVCNFYLLKLWLSYWDCSESELS